MNLNSRRDIFIKKNIKNITKYEDDYNINKIVLNKQECNKISKDYIYNCDKAEILTKIREFFDDKWYDNTIRDIDNYKTLLDTKNALEKVIHFKHIHKISISDNDHDDKTLGYINKCIKKRIQYKYSCIPENKHDTGHDAEILRHIFYKKRYYELKDIVRRIRTKHIEIKDELNKQDIEFRKLELQLSSDDFTPIVSKNKKKRTRIKRH